MTLQKQVGFWVGALAVVILLLWLLQSILLPFIAGFVLAYFLDPIADRLESIGLPRLVATAIILLSAIVALAFVGLMIVPVFADQSVKLAGELPALMKSLVERANEIAPQRLKDMLANSGTDIQGSLGTLAGKAASWLATFITSLWSGGMALVNILSLLIITPIVAFYLLADWDHIVAKIDDLIPRDHLEEVRGIARDINTALAGFIRGQGTVCLLLGVFYAIGLSLAGLKSGLAIGFAAGMLSFIPYVGALIGGLLAIGVGLVQYWPNETQVLVIIGVFVVGQILEGNFLSPKLVGGSIGLHPVWMMFALLAFSYVFGFLGLLLAVPLAAATGVFVRYGLDKYVKSKLYTGIAVASPPIITKITRTKK
jgi:predicted PurR-regulated permease PerM